MAEAVCAQCGQALEADSRFCPSCGTPTEAAAAGASDAAAPPSAPELADPPAAAVPAPVVPGQPAATAATAATGDDPVPRYFAFARGAKIVALLGLFLPWVTVSCAGQPLASINGVGLMSGRVTTRDPSSGVSEVHNGSPEWLMYGVIAAIVFALVATFIWPRRKAALAALWGCAAAMLLAVVEVYMLIPQHLHQAMRQNPTKPSDLGRSFDSQMEAGMAQMIRIEPASGFWLTMAALVAALVLCWLIRARVPEEA
ncbi:MAG: hypothetical protein QOE79_2774 [Sphingomonadales bacterium]|jgi:hypothetical protein|nr:hypothetical protein [Sphingomonadales bacterium]